MQNMEKGENRQETKDISRVDMKSGKLEWAIFTQKSKLRELIFFFELWLKDTTMIYSSL